MPVKPDTPITRKEMYLDVATGGSLQLPSPVTREEKYLAKIAGESVDIPTPVTRYEMLLAAVTGESYTLTPVTRLEVYLAKAAGQDVDVPQPVTREEMYWFDYVNGQPTPSEQEYTGAVPVTFTANGQPLLDYLISSNTVQSGTPTPDNPIMPQGTGERTAQLIPEIVQGGVSTADGSFSQSSNRVRTKYIPVESGKTYAVSSGNLYLATGCYYNNGVFSSKIDEVVAVTTSATFTVPENINQIAIGFRTDSGTTDITPSDLQNYMLNEGSTALPYEPYGYKIPISSASTTTNIYLGEVETTRKVKKLVLTGNENNWGKYTRSDSTTVPYLPLSDFKGASATNIKADIKCTHYDTKTQVNIQNTTNKTGIAGRTSIGIIIADESISTLADFKNYLQQQYAAGTPVCVWYVLATEETGIVNEPLQKIGDYADTLSMEQAGVEIPTVNGSNTLDVDTTVKPSEVYIKYKGEPIVGSQTSSQSSAYAPAEVSSQSENVDDINNSLLGKEEETE